MIQRVPSGDYPGDREGLTFRDRLNFADAVDQISAQPVARQDDIAPSQPEQGLGRCLQVNPVSANKGRGHAPSIGGQNDPGMGAVKKTFHEIAEGDLSLRHRPSDIVRCARVPGHAF